MNTNKNAIKNLIDKYATEYNYQEFTKEEFKLLLTVFADELKVTILELLKNPPIINKNL